MARQIDFRSPLPHPADIVYATMVDAEYLRARLQRLGGPGAALLEHQADADGCPLPAAAGPGQVRAAAAWCRTCCRGTW